MISLDAVEAGPYELQILVQLQDQWVVCPLKRKFTVR